MGSYVPSTKKQQQEMLDIIGVSHVDELFAHLPQDMILKKPLNIPDGLSELEVSRKMEELAEKNKVFKSIFRGAGAYNHYIPSIVKSVNAKEEFVTAYTPYQPEISQGILQNIFEYQTLICELTGMDGSNASVYDGAQAAAEALTMCRDRKRTKALISSAANPQTIETIKTYSWATDVEFELINTVDGKTDLEDLRNKLTDATASVFIQQPNFFGVIEDAEEIVKLAHEKGAKAIMSVNPISTMLLKTPGECGADIAVGEAQPLGMPLSFGGPYLGFMAAKTAMVRNLPGRIVGETVDADGKRAFVLTLQAREQHIRREKASSNVCSNQAWCALTASTFAAALGANGLKEMAVQSMSKAHYLADQLTKIGFELKYKSPYFHEFVTTCKVCSEKILNHLEAHGILGGLPLCVSDESILWCATEMNTKQEMDRLVELVKQGVSL